MTDLCVGCPLLVTMVLNDTASIVFKSLVKKWVFTLSLAPFSTVTRIWEQIMLACWASVFIYKHGGTVNNFNITTLGRTYKYAWHDF